MVDFSLTFIAPAVIAELARLADLADRSSDWPRASWDQLRAAGVPAWNVPVAFGGKGLPAPDLLSGYEQLASACLTTAFILSQREAAVRRLCVYPAPALQERFLPALARGEVYATVGLSQLTTSRQHQGPSLAAHPLGNATQPEAYQLDGLIPWVTGADQADLIVIGAVLPDQRQVLFILPKWQPGVSVEPPLSLLALAGSRTAQIRCDGVVLPADLVLAGPGEKLLAVGGGGVGGLETSCLAIGLAGAAIGFLHGEAECRPDLVPMTERFQAGRLRLRKEMHLLAGGGVQDDSRVVALRVQATQLALQSTQAALTVAKGAGFVAPHPVERWVRQALFFLVWSCPRSVSEGLLMQVLSQV